MISQFNIPSTVLTGAGASRELVPQLQRLGARRILLVTDAFMVTSGLAGTLVREMEKAGLAVALFAGVQPDPTDVNVRDGFRIFTDQRCDTLVALGGMAFANSSVALVHGMSRPIGAVFHVPHGLSNSMLLPAVTRFSLGAAPGRYATIAKAMRLCAPEADEAAAGAALIQGLVDLNTRLEVPRLRDCPGFELKKFESVLEKMAADALASGSPQNNPRVPTADEIVALYREAW